MKNENGFMGQVDLMALLGAELKVVDSVDCIVLPLKYNPSIEIYQKKNGKTSASLNLFMNDNNNKYGHSHYIRASVSKKVLDRYSMTYETAKPYCPIIGNMKPVTSGKIHKMPAWQDVSLGRKYEVMEQAFYRYTNKGGMIRTFRMTN